MDEGGPLRNVMDEEVTGIYIRRKEFCGVNADETKEISTGSVPIVGTRKSSIQVQPIVVSLLSPGTFASFEEAVV